MDRHPAHDPGRGARADRALARLAAGRAPQRCVDRRFPGGDDDLVRLCLRRRRPRASRPPQPALPTAGNRCDRARRQRLHPRAALRADRGGRNRLRSAYAAGAHVRLALLSRRFPPRATAAIELAGSVCILVPLCALIVADGIDSSWRAFLQGERWADTGWAVQWIVRLWIPLGFALLMAAGLARALRALLALTRK